VQTTTSLERDDTAEALLTTLFALIRSSRRFGESSTLTWSNYAVLSQLCLSERDVRLTEIADVLRCDISVLSRQVTTLIDQGLVSRLRDPGDGRAWKLRVTEQGEATMRAAKQRWLDQMRGWLADFGIEEQQGCTRLLAALNQGIIAAPRGARADRNTQYN